MKGVLLGRKSTITNFTSLTCLKTQVLVIWRAGTCSMAALPRGKRQNVCDRYPGHESGERKERCPGYEGRAPDGKIEGAPISNLLC